MRHNSMNGPASVQCIIARNTHPDYRNIILTEITIQKRSCLPIPSVSVDYAPSKQQEGAVIAVERPSSAEDSKTPPRRSNPRFSNPQENLERTMNIARKPR